MRVRLDLDYYGLLGDAEHFQSELKKFAQEVSNERMYQMYIKSIGGRQAFGKNMIRFDT